VAVLMLFPKQELSLIEWIMASQGVSIQKATLATKPTAISHQLTAIYSKILM
jgi:hypothetical protein